MTSLLRKIIKKKKSQESINERVYGLEEYDNSYEITRKVLSWVALRMSHRISAFTTKYWQLFYWFELLNLVVFGASELMGMVATVQHAADFRDGIKVFRMIPCFGWTVIYLPITIDLKPMPTAVVKSAKMVLYRPVFENIVLELRAMWPQGEVYAEEHRTISNALHQLNFVIKGYYWCNIGLLFSFLSPPYFLLAGRYLGYDYPRLLHFVYWLPFDVFQPYTFEFWLLLQTWQATVVIFFNLSWDMLFCTFLSHITTQFDLVALRVRCLIHVPEDRQLIACYPLAAMGAERTRANNDAMSRRRASRHQRELTDIVLMHHTLIRLAGDVEEMFSFSLLINFINSSIIICFCGFCCVLVEKWKDIAYKSFLLTALAQTWLLCWYGQKLLDSSLSVSLALYESGWYVSTQKIKTSVLIMLHRSQKGICVTTYGFSPISLASFSTIIKTAWSYFTLLLNVYNAK